MTLQGMAAAAPNGSTYPAREPFFAHRFCRLLIKTCAAQQLGPSATLLLMTIAHTEDAARYKRGVTFWDGQLMPIIGVASWRALNRARVAAVETGWLVYVPGSKGRAGVYWVTIPDAALGIDDFPVDEGAGEFHLRSARASAAESKMQLHCAGASGGDASSGAQATSQTKSSPFNPFPDALFPIPNEEYCSEPLNAASEPPSTCISTDDRKEYRKRTSITGPPNDDSTCLPTPEDPVVLSIPCVGRGPDEWPLRKSKLDEYVESFPGIDVLSECRNARQWVIDNRTRRKTFAGVPAFLTRWLSKSQNQGGKQSGFNAGRSYRPSSEPTRIRSCGASQYDGIV